MVINHLLNGMILQVATMAMAKKTSWVSGVFFHPYPPQVKNMEPKIMVAKFGISYSRVSFSGSMLNFGRV